MTVFSLLIGVSAVIFAVCALYLPGIKARRTVASVNLASLLAGAALLAAASVQSRRAAALTDNADLLAWAEDAFVLWIRFGSIFTAAVGGALFLAALIRHRMRRVRALAGCACTVLILLAGSAYAVLCASETVDPSAWVRLSTLGLAWLSTAWSAVDLWRGERCGSLKTLIAKNK